jgi:hypothetical protein
LIFAVRKGHRHRLSRRLARSKNIHCASRRAGAASCKPPIYAIEEVLKAYGMSYRDIERWGGKSWKAPNPSGAVPQRPYPVRQSRRRLRRRRQKLGTDRAQRRHALSGDQQRRGAPHEQAGIS